MDLASTRKNYLNAIRILLLSPPFLVLIVAITPGFYLSSYVPLFIGQMVAGILAISLAMRKDSADLPFRKSIRTFGVVVAVGGVLVPVCFELFIDRWCMGFFGVQCPRDQIANMLVLFLLVAIPVYFISTIALFVSAFRSMRVIRRQKTAIDASSLDEEIMNDN
jgi:ABC-type multidrug transport system fused ATPase/permease subunit